MFALGMQLLLWLLFVAFLLLASLVVAVLGAVHVARRATWKRLARFPGPNEDVPLRWVVQQHVHATSVKHRTPYNVSMLELRMAYFHMYQKYGLFRFYIGPHPTVAVFKADYIETVLNGQSTIEKSVDYEVLHSWLGTGLLTSLSSQITVRVQSPWLLVDAIYFRTSYGKAYQRNTEIVHNFTARVIKERRKELERNNGAHAVNEEEPEGIYNRKRLLTFLDILLRYSIDNDGSISDEDIREEVDTFMFEGHDTTAVAICWTLYMMGLHQDHQTMVLEELDSVLGKGAEEDVTTEHMKELKYLDCVIKECQRLYPSVPIIGRESVEDFKLGDYVIPKGSTIDVFIYALHRDPEVFPDPERFDPSRFLPENVSKRHSHAFIPFSAGSRNCIGQRFAAMELKIVIATILRSFRVAALDQRDKMLLSSDLVLRAAGGIRLSFTPRVHGDF